MSNDITALALIAKIKTQTKSFDTVVLQEDEANVLVEALEKAQASGKTYQQSFFRQSLMYDVVAEAYEEAKEQIAQDVQIKARLCRESNSLFNMLRIAERRIAELDKRLIEYAGIATREAHRVAELEARTVILPEPISVLHRRDFTDAHRAIYAYPEAEVSAALAAAGIKVKGD